jgi:hypothetical protein
MVRSVRLAAMILVLTFSYGVRASANTYYIAASGADANNGTSVSTPWLHAPGMPNCTATCASTTPQPGDSFIFRGGDAWHINNSVGSPYVGTKSSGCSFGEANCGWTWTASGSSTNCVYPTSTSSCIYIGVDTSWYSGSSFSRPVLSMDNPTSTSIVASCTYDQAGNASTWGGGGPMAFGETGSYVIFDNFELTGGCDSKREPTYFGISGQHVTFRNLYLHGWTEATNADDVPMLDMNATRNNNTELTYSVIDGSDAFCKGSGACIGYLGATFNYYDHNVCRYIGGCIGSPSNLISAHDNLFEFVYQGYCCGVHGDVVHMYGNSMPAGSSIYFYNNIVRNTSDGTTNILDVPSGGTLYFFNNVFFGIGNDPNCFTPQLTDNNTISIYVTNNTVVAPCTIQASNQLGGLTGHQNWFLQNNHFIGFSSSTIAGITSVQGGQPLTASFTDNGNEIFQSVSGANGQGYTASNNYLTTATGSATYHAGGSLSSSCSSYSGDSGLCRGTTGGVTYKAGTTEATLEIPSPPARGTTWDAGAYQFSGQTVIQPNPPSGLVARVQ